MEESGLAVRDGRHHRVLFTRGLCAGDDIFAFGQFIKARDLREPGNHRLLHERGRNEDFLAGHFESARGGVERNDRVAVGDRHGRELVAGVGGGRQGDGLAGFGHGGGLAVDGGHDGAVGDFANRDCAHDDRTVDLQRDFFLRDEQFAVDGGNLDGVLALFGRLPRVDAALAERAFAVNKAPSVVTFVVLQREDQLELAVGQRLFRLARVGDGGGGGTGETEGHARQVERAPLRENPDVGVTFRHCQRRFALANCAQRRALGGVGIQVCRSGIRIRAPEDFNLAAGHGGIVPFHRDGCDILPGRLGNHDALGACGVKLD